MKKTLSILIFSFLFIVGCSSVDISTIQNSGFIMNVDSLDHDWGDISIDGGDVQHGFHFKNDSDDELILKGMVTSCMCTTAYIELSDGTISPSFGMHNNEEWNYTVQAGEEFEVEVIFDPMAHGPDAVGLIQRGILLLSSNTAGDVQMSVLTNVMYDDEYQIKYRDSDFVFEETEYDFGIVKQSSGINSVEFPFTYLGEESILVTGVPTSCSCTEAEISQNEFETGDSGFVTVYFDPNLHEEPEGKFFKTISVLTDPELEKQAELKIWVEMDLDLGPESYKLQEHID